MTIGIRRSALVRTTSAATILALVGALWVSSAAVAAPNSAATAEAATMADPALLTEKAAAIVALGFAPEATLTGLADCDLTIALWQRLDGQPFRDEVRAAAVSAFADQAALEGDSTACTTFIRTGVYEAKARDLAVEQRVKAERQAEHDLKLQAAQTIGIVADATMLELTVKEFVWELRARATGDQVRAAAEAAYNGTDADRTAFLSDGINVAHEADRRKQIELDNAGNIAEQERLLEEAARTRAMAILLVAITEGMLAATDRDFITYIWENARPGSEVRAAAEAAILSREPADWHAFIHTGMRAAYDEDVQIALRQKHQADVAEANALITRANTDGFLNLARAAKAAIARTPTELDDFLRHGQYDLDLSTSLETGDIPPNWSNSPAWVNSVRNIGGYCCALTGPELGVRAELGHTGDSALMYSGKDNSATSSFAYLRSLKLSRVRINPLSALSYWIYPTQTTTSTNATCVAIDLMFSDGRNLRDSGAVDQRGNRAHPAQQCGKLTANQWNQVIVPLGSLFNQESVTVLRVGYDQPLKTGGYRGYIDDITITEQPGVQPSDAASASQRQRPAPAPQATGPIPDETAPSVESTDPTPQLPAQTLDSAAN